MILRYNIKKQHRHTLPLQLKHSFVAMSLPRQPTTQVANLEFPSNCLVSDTKITRVSLVQIHFKGKQGDVPPGFEITMKTHCDGDIFEPSFSF